VPSSAGTLRCLNIFIRIVACGMSCVEGCCGWGWVPDRSSSVIFRPTVSSVREAGRARPRAGISAGRLALPSEASLRAACLARATEPRVSPLVLAAPSEPPTRIFGEPTCSLSFCLIVRNFELVGPSVPRELKRRRIYSGAAPNCHLLLK